MTCSSAAECMLLQSMAINKLKMELKGGKDGTEVITLPETMRVTGVKMYSAVHRSENGKVGVLLINTPNKNMTLNQGTQIRFFQACSTTIKTANENQIDETGKKKNVSHIC